MLLRKRPLSSQGLAQPMRLTDGAAAPNADHWDSQLTTRIEGSEAFAVYDLGKSTAIDSLFLQGDANDDYFVEASEDGKEFTRIWSASPKPGAVGMQDRSIKGLNAHGRFLRISAAGGDHKYSLSELQAFASTPDSFPPKVVRKRGQRADIGLRTDVITFGLALALLAILTYRRAPWWWLALTFAPALATGWIAVRSVLEVMPPDQRTVSLVRGMIGVVGALAIAREAFAPKRLPAHRGATLSVLTVCGVLGLLSFYNLGYPQFWDHQTGKPTYVHHLDLRQYYATAKYFPEIGYVGLYAADVAAYLDDAKYVTLDSIASQNMRDLKSHRVGTVGEQRERILHVKERFSPERWEAYKLDQRYFRRVMSVPRYLEMMNDFGGNATPVWISIGYVLFNALDATDANFILTGLLDPLLLITALIAIGFIFGPRTAFLGMILFGANDLIMYGSNWGGATLRHDWMAYLAFGACALRRERWTLAGFFLAMATLIRAFPALSLIALGIPAFWQVAESLWIERKLPKLSALIEQQRWALRVALAAAVTAVVAVVASSAILGHDAWPLWWSKVSHLTADPHANHISLRSLIAGSDFDQHSVLRSRMPVFIVACAVYLGLIAIGARGRRPEQIAMLGMITLPIFFDPSNYYIHFMWLLPMILIEQPRDAERSIHGNDAWAWISLLLMCGAQYWTTYITDRPLHFYLGGVCLFAAITPILAFYAATSVPDLLVMLARRPERVPSLAPEPTPAESPAESPTGQTQTSPS